MRDWRHWELMGEEEVGSNGMTDLEYKKSRKRRGVPFYVKYEHVVFKFNCIHPKPPANVNKCWGEHCKGTQGCNCLPF